MPEIPVGNITFSLSGHRFQMSAPDLKVALHPSYIHQTSKDEGRQEESARIRQSLLTEISNLSAGRLGHSPEAAHVLLAVRAAIDRICPEAGK